MDEIRPLSSELAQIAREELQEDPKQLTSDLQSLKAWIAKHNYLTSRTDNQFLIAFLRGSKFSLEKTKEKIENYYAVKTSDGDFFRDRDPLDIKLQEIMAMGVSLPLPVNEKSQDSRLFLIRLGIFEPSKFSVADVMKVCFMIMERLILECDNSIVVGHTVLVDLKAISFGLLSQFTPTLIKKLTATTELYPIRIKAIHFINPSTGFESLYKIFCGFLSDKIRDRVFVHDSLEELQKVVPKDSLPSDYGGSGSPLGQVAREWMKKLIENRDWFKEDETFGIDEDKKSLYNGLKSAKENIFGVDGSFRALNVD